MRYIIYDNTGEILRTVSCPPECMAMQVKAGENVMVATEDVDDVTQKVVDGEIVDKTPEEMTAKENPTISIPEDKQLACINNAQWRDVLSRLKNLENKA